MHASRQKKNIYIYIHIHINITFRFFRFSTPQYRPVEPLRRIMNYRAQTYFSANPRKCKGDISITLDFPDFKRENSYILAKFRGGNFPCYLDICYHFGKFGMISDTGLYVGNDKMCYYIGFQDKYPALRALKQGTIFKGKKIDVTLAYWPDCPAFDQIE